MTLSQRALNRATLHRQLLLRRERTTVPQAMRQIVALQAQEPASPYLALWNRIEGFDPAELDHAFEARELVRATLFRMTLHAVRSDDYPAAHAAMMPRLRDGRVYDKRYTAAGLTPADADELLPRLLAHAAEARTVDELLAWVEATCGTPRPWAWWALKTYAPLHHVSTGGTWAYARRSFRAATETWPEDRRREAIGRVILRYLTGFGPATMLDIAQFTGLPRPLLREVLREQDLVALDGGLYDLPGAELPPENVPAPPRLLGMWDSLLLCYADRSRIIPPDVRRIVSRQNGDVLPTLLVDGFVAGIWRATADGIEATAFRPLDDDTWHALTAEAAALSRFLEPRDPLVYKRYAHWWAKLTPGPETRLLR